MLFNCIGYLNILFYPKKLFGYWSSRNPGNFIVYELIDPSSLRFLLTALNNLIIDLIRVIIIRRNYF